MGNITDKLSYLNDTKKAIKNAITSRGVTVSDNDTFRDYASKITEIGETVSKLGLSIDDFIGEVKDGVMSAPNVIPVADFSGVEIVGDNAADGLLAYRKGWLKNVSEIKNIGRSGFSNFLDNCNSGTSVTNAVSFDSIESITANNAFLDFGGSTNFPKNALAYISFPMLKTISAGAAFMGFASKIVPTNIETVFDDVFPSLEEVSGKQVFNNFITYSENQVVTFSKLKKITGDASSKTSSTFYMINKKNTIWNFPNVTEISGYIWNSSSSYAGEIHFAVANQAVIEASDKYADKWGFTGATIYFDL